MDDKHITARRVTGGARPAPTAARAGLTAALMAALMAAMMAAMMASLLALAACGGGGGASASTAASSSDTADAATTTSDESWRLATGANAADLVDTGAAQRVAIALDTLSVTAPGARWAVGGASAGSTPVLLDGSTVVTVAEDGNGLTITSSVPSGTLAEFALSGQYGKTVTVYSAQPYKLTLDGVTIASSDGPAINLQSPQRAFVNLASGSVNVLGDTSTYSARTLADGTAMDLKATFFSEGALVIGGSGQLAVTAASKHALASDAHVRLREGTLVLTANKKDGLRANQAFVMDGGNLSIQTASGAGKGIKVDGQEDAVNLPLGFVAINAGTLTINSHDKAITAAWEGDEDGDTATLADDPDPRVTINGGTITISTFGTPYEDTYLADGDSSLAPEGIEAKSVLTINGGTLLITTTDDALNAGSAIVINGGRIRASSSANDAIDSNGSLTITGGVVVADGAGGAEGGLDCDQNTFTVTGGTVVGIGGRNSTVTRSVTTQNTVSLRNLAAGLLVIRDASGQAVFAYTLPKAAGAVLVSAPTITTGATYAALWGGVLGSIGGVALFQDLALGALPHSGGTVLVNSFTVTSSVTSL